MPLEFWLAMIGQLAVIVGAAVRLEHRITKLETDMRWLIGRRANDREERGEPH